MTKDRLDEILDVLTAYARQDFTPRLEVSAALDEIDAIATGINLLAEELHGEVASRRELEAAYEHLQAAQAQLVVVEKLAAVGQLAAGVAHELNNPATWVMLGIHTVQRRLARARALAGDNRALLDELAGADATLTDARTGIERMRAVIGDLRTLTRSEGDDPVPLDLNAIVRAACQLSRPAYHGIAHLTLDLGDVPRVLGHHAKLGQLVTNLLVNAAHAVADRPGAQEIAIVTRHAGGRITLAVEDSGPGIPAALWERVFDPYFTTKPSEFGTGLGLTLVRNIAATHGGSARVARGTRPGARIEVDLPALADARAAAEPPPPPAPAPSQVRGRILLVDDEPLLLRALEQAILEQHDVVIALGGAHAIELLARDRAFDLVLCDLQMPQVDGIAVRTALAARAPDLLDRFVIMSGGAVTPRAATFLDEVRPRVLAKPIVLDELLDLARALTRPRVTLAG